ncbi:uncharacterized protein LOC127263886 [Andrographis paniculata]|uniref:uncharacterized protein LOC127263886 n=1 Tax=Andrographis paniculata TaxID=175694 RepID=UPI0021E938C9|nr:uncharacterized protein LOC127263886 [Andrographis paniculata]
MAAAAAGSPSSNYSSPAAASSCASSSPFPSSSFSPKSSLNSSIAKAAAPTPSKNNSNNNSNNYPASSSSMKLKGLLQTLFLSHMYRIARALHKAKELLLHLFKDIGGINAAAFLGTITKAKKRKQPHNIFFGSFRLYYNWCSSQPYAYSSSATANSTQLHYFYDNHHHHHLLHDPWNTDTTTAASHHRNYVVSPKRFPGYEEYSDSSTAAAAELSRYLQWLEERGRGCSHEEERDSCSNEIDRLADLFIADCHEKFRLEKQESYRMFQEMMARSV